MTTDRVNRHPLKEKRRANKPLLERKRRARINDSLCDLKHLVLTSLNKDVSKFSKMEKVDILDMTVQFLKGRCQENLNLIYERGYKEGSKDLLYNILSMNNIGDETKIKINSHLQEHTPPPSPISYYQPPPRPSSLPKSYTQKPKYILPHPVSFPALNKSVDQSTIQPSYYKLSNPDIKTGKPVWRPW